MFKLILNAVKIAIIFIGLYIAFGTKEEYVETVKSSDHYLDDDEEIITYSRKFRPFGLVIFFIGLLTFMVIIIPANSVGIKYSSINGVSDTPMSEGFHIVAPFVTKVTKIDTTIQERTIEEISIQTKDGERVMFEVNVKYSINQDNAATVFKRYGSMENLKTNIIRNDTEAAMAKVVSQNSTKYILTEGRPAIESAVVEDLSKRFAEEGVELRSFTIKQSDGSEEYVQRMNKIKDSENAVEEAENKRKAAEIDAEKKIIEAQAEADANEILSKELTKEVLEKMFYEKWDGVLPQVWGSDGNIIDLGKVAE